MPFQLVIGHRAKSWKVESNSESFIGLKLGEKIEGKEILPELEGYVFEISGASDKAGIPSKKDVEGSAIKRVLLTKGWGMHTSRPKGLRLKKTVRGNALSADTLQINLKVEKEGSKKFEEIFPEQNKPKEKAAQTAQAPAAAN